jgi:hypothetical protein
MRSIGGFAGVVGRERQRQAAVDRADGADGAALLGDHLAAERAAGIDGAIVVDLPHAVVRGEVHVHDGLGVGDQPCRGDQHGGGPHVLLDGGGHHVHALVIGNVARIEARLATPIVDELGARRAGFLALIEDGNGVAVLGEAAGGRLADAAGASGDDGKFPG